MPTIGGRPSSIAWRVTISPQLANSPRERIRSSASGPARTGPYRIENVPRSSSERTQATSLDTEGVPAAGMDPHLPRDLGLLWVQHQEVSLPLLGDLAPAP